jgi:tRNA-Thr(GGU) m(6)t(6)A37 methyltransferase TsaA
MLNFGPIGYVRNGITESQDFSDVISDIVILPRFTDGLFRLEENDQIDVIFVFDRNMGEGYRLRLHPRGDESIPERGVFATRTPFRPNPIGLERVKLLGVEGNVVKVKGLDAFDGTPVLDIKPTKRLDRKLG